MKKLVLVLVFGLVLSLTISIFSQINYWSSTNWTGSSGYVFAIKVDSSDHIYAATYDAGVYKSTDKGQTWTNLNVPTTNFTCITITNSNDVMLGTFGDGIYKSIDYGATWNKLLLQADSINNIVISPNHSIFVATFGDSAIYRSLDNGVSWEVKTDGIEFGTIPLGALTIEVGSSGILYTSTYSDKIFRSSNNGENWIQTNFNQPNYANIITLLVTDSGYVFAGGFGVFRSSNEGQTWETVNSGVQNETLFVRKLIANNEGYVFRAREYSGGVYVSGNNGNYWSNRSSGLTENAIMDLAIDTDGDIFAASFGDGVFIANSSITSVFDKNISVLSTFILSQNYPNPFNPSTKIRWQSPVSGWQTLKVYDVLGNEVATLVDEYRSAGSYEVEFIGNNLVSGIYFYRLQAGDFVQTKKMILLK